MKKGQIQISFGMIFSIIIIIFTVAIAVYVISKFMGTKECVNANLFYNEIKEKVDKAWGALISQDVFTGSVPAGTKKVCFGNLTLASLDGLGLDSEQIKEMEKYRGRNVKANMFMLFENNPCENFNPYYNLEHARADFFCVSPKNGKVEVRISHDYKIDSLVRILPISQ